MKKLLRNSSVKVVFSILLLTMTYTSCKKDSPPETSSQSKKYSELKSWYNTEKLKSSDSILPGLKPDWNKVKIRQDSTKIIYEIEVENPNKVFLANQKVDVSNATNAYKLSQFRLVIIFDQKTNTNQGAYMNILGDDSNESNKEVYYKKAGTFSGKIQYYGISGRYINGWVYSKGKITRTIRESRLIPINNIKTEENSCSVTATPRYGMICAGAENGGCTVTLLGWNYSTSCESFNPDYGEGGGGGGGGGIGPAPENGGGGGSGGGGNSPGGPGYTSDHGLVGKGVLPPNNTDDTQFGATCVFKTVEWISKFFKGEITASIAITDYGKTYNLSGLELIKVINTEGVTSDRLPGIVNKYFNTKNPTSFNAAIDAGHPLFGTLINSDGGGHEVMITGYNNNGTIEYFDPEIGKYATKNPGDFTHLIEVTSHKY